MCGFIGGMAAALRFLSLAKGLATTTRPEQCREKLTIGGEETTTLLDRALVILKRVCATTQRIC